MEQNKALPPIAKQNIDTIVNLERDFVRQRTLSQKVADNVGRFAGTMLFVILHITFFAAWFMINSRHLSPRAFDPYSYILLGVLVSVESVLMMQHRMQRRADERAHLNLQIDLLAEREVTKVLQLQRLMCERPGISQALVDQEVGEMANVTPVQNVSRGLRQELDNVE